MSKALFRWLRGEINGYYLNNINSAWNEYTAYIRDFFGYRSGMQFELNKIENRDLQGLGKFAGVFLPRITVGESKTSIKMTESHIDNNDEEISESGLYNTSDELFDFTLREESGDINDYASPELRSSMVGTESTEGYISSEEEDVLDDEGLVKASAVTHNPPASPTAYGNFYGNQFLFLSEAETTFETVEKSLFIELFKVMQYIRYNGLSLQSFCKLVSVICPNGLVKIVDVQSVAKRFYVTYAYDEEVIIDHKQQRLSLLFYVIGIKFTQVTMLEQ